MNSLYPVTLHKLSTKLASAEKCWSNGARDDEQEGIVPWRQLGDLLDIAASLHNLGIVAHEQGDYAAAQDYHKEALVLQKESGDRLGFALSLTNLGLVAHHRGDHRVARELFEESLVQLRDGSLQRSG